MEYEEYMEYEENMKSENNGSKNEIASRCFNI